MKWMFEILCAACLQTQGYRSIFRETVQHRIKGRGPCSYKIYKICFEICYFKQFQFLKYLIIIIIITHNLPQYCRKMIFFAIQQQQKTGANEL